MGTTQTTHAGFTLRDGAEFDGGTVDVGEGKALDVAKALEEGGGLILVPLTDEYALNALAEYPPLERVSETDLQASAGKRLREETVKDLERTTVEHLTDLIDGANAAGAALVVPDNARKADLVRLLADHTLKGA